MSLILNNFIKNQLTEKSSGLRNCCCQQQLTSEDKYGIYGIKRKVANLQYISAYLVKTKPTNAGRAKNTFIGVPRILFRAVNLINFLPVIAYE